MGTGAEVALIVAATAATAGSVYQASQAAGQKPNIPVAPSDPTPPAQADTSSFKQSQDNANRLAQTAGGTISQPGSQNQIGSDNGMAPRKTLLGS